jgi:glycosyltransferase involved in cell wall biosynthesis
MRLALLMNLAPRKLGSFEGWLLALAAEAERRGHALDVFGRQPVHPEVARALSSVGASVAPLEELERAPLAAVRRLAGYDAIQLNLLQPRSNAALLAYAAWPARVLFMARSDALPVSLPPLRRVLSRAADAVTFARVDTVAAVSEYVRERVRARFDLDRARTRVLYNGIDATRFRPPPGLRRAPGEATFVAVAHLVPHKGIDVLLRAFARVPAPVRLRVVGDGPHLAALDALGRALGVSPRVELLGLRDDVPEILRGADACVHPTLAEGFGNAVAEAMASGLPVIATRAGGIPELVEAGISGLLVPPGDEDALAAAMARVAADPELRARLGEHARRRVLARFTVEASVAGHLDWCEERAALSPRGRRQTAAPRIAAAVSRR